MKYYEYCFLIVIILCLSMQVYCFDNKNLAAFAANPEGRAAKTTLLERDGMQFIKTEFYPTPVTGEPWPCLISNFGDGYFDEQDFTKYKYLYCLVYNPSSCDIVKLRMDDMDKKRVTLDVPINTNDYSLCIVETKKIPTIDKTRVTHFNIFLEEPAEPVELWIGGIALADKIDNAVLNLASKTMLKQCEDVCQKLAAAKSNWAKVKASEMTDLCGILKGNWSAEKELAVITKQLVPKNVDENLPFFENTRNNKYSVTVIPSTLKLRKDQSVYAKNSTTISLDAARGEGESKSLLISANNTELTNVKLTATLLDNKKGGYIYPEIHPLGYVNITNPTPVQGGFGIPGMYPDPILTNEPFDVGLYENTAVLYTVNVPRDAEPGTYTGLVKVEPYDEKPVEIKVTLRVYNVTLLPQSYLKQVFATRNAPSSSVYYDYWSPEHFRSFTKLHMKYRMNCQQMNSHGILDFSTVFSQGADGRISADWTEFDEQVSYWFGLGMTQFWGYFTGWASSVDSIADKDFLRSRLGLLAAHLKEQGWLDRFFLYFYDEPSPEMAEQIKNICNWVHREGIGLRILHTYGHKDQEQYIGHADVIIPHINVFNPSIGDKVRENGGEYWVYTCISNRSNKYPDNWKIDNYGTSHRALGWWMYQYKAQGYLYWGTDYWENNPWENPETYPGGNGDGSLFYPSPDRTSLPYPSLRMDNYRDGIEEYDLLTMLEDMAKKDPLTLLKSEKVISAPESYSTDDELYIKLHKELLEKLEKAEAKAKKKK